MAGVVNVMASVGLGASGAGSNPFSSSSSAASAPEAQSAAPAATVSLSEDGRALLMQLGALNGAIGSAFGNGFSNVSALLGSQGVNPQGVLSIGAADPSGGLANRLVDAAILTALFDSSRKDEDDNKKGANALVVAAAVQAYLQVAGMPAANTVTAVLGAGGVNISVSAAA